MGDPGIDGKMISKWKFKKWDRRHGPEKSGSGQGHVGAVVNNNNSNKPSVFTKCRKFLDYMRTY
jgi:hypothetical protein